MAAKFGTGAGVLGRRMYVLGHVEHIYYLLTVPAVLLCNLPLSIRGPDPACGGVL